MTGGGTGLVGHAGAILLRKAADQAGLTAALSAALRKAGSSPLLDRGIVLVSMAAAIALGATSMSDIAVLAHLAPVLGDAPSGPTIRRALDLAGLPGMLDRVARARARARAHVWTLIGGTPAGFPWLTSTPCTASTPSWRPAGSGPPKPWACGTCHLKGFAQNQVWCEIVALACELLAWTQMLALPGTARRWEPRRLRLRLFAIAGRLARTSRRLRLRLAQN